MESLGYYWNFFVDVEKREFFRFLGLMRNLSPTDGWLVSYWPLLFLFALEFVFPWRKEQRKLRFGIWLDVFYVYFNVLLMWALFGRAVVETTILAFNHVLYASFGITNLVAIKLTNMQMWARLVLMLLFVDFLSYLGHWVLHRVNFLWQFHKIHHSSTELDVWNA